MLTISLCYLYLKLLKIDSFAYILSKISLNFYNGWFLFFFICLQLNLLHNLAATRHFGFTRKKKENEGKEKRTGKLIKNSLKIRRI